MATAHYVGAAFGFAATIGLCDMPILVFGGSRWLFENVRGKAFSKRTEGGYREDFMVRRLKTWTGDVRSMERAHGSKGPWLDSAQKWLDDLRTEVAEHSDPRVRESDAIAWEMTQAQKTLRKCRVEQRLS